MSARASMALLVGLLLAPITASAVAANYYFLETFNTQVQQDALQVAHRVAEDVDREVVLIENALHVLGDSPLLAAGDRVAFESDATEIGRVLGIALSLEPGMVPAASGPADRTPTVSDAVAVAGGTVIRIAVPIALADQPATLAATVDPSRFVRLLSTTEASGGWTIALVGGDDRIVARSRLHETFVGRLATDDLRARTAAGKEGVWTGRTLEGVEVLSAFVRSDVTGWRTAVGVPAALVEAPRRASLIWLAMIAFVGLAASIAVATILGSRIAAVMGETAAAAKALARAEPPVFRRRTTLRELAEINTALVEASAELERRATARDRYERDLLIAASRLERVLNTAPVGILEVDAGGTVILANDTAVGLLGGEGPLVGRHYADPAWGFAHTEDGPALAVDDMPVARALRGERVEDLEITLHGDAGEPRVLSIDATPIERGRQVTGAIVTVSDVSNRHLAERRRQLLINELNHRVKNTLASVQAIIEQTLAAASTPGEAERAIGDRLRAMAGAHDLLTRANWEGADLLGVVEAAIAPFRTAHHDRFDVAAGPLVRLAPRAALPVVLALHELATNAVKYGALSVRTGRVAVGWVLADGETAFVFTWIETGGPPVSPPTRHGFGSRLLTRGLAMELDAVVTLDYRPEGLACRVAVPMAANTVQIGPHRPADAR